ncbi:MAG TPA: multiheme c-type cytochrome [Tepidisphaeraceae bacterium]|nr:multiheme c-type cytochrome [Tepidisphaeraceae bacterium]
MTPNLRPGWTVLCGCFLLAAAWIVVAELPHSAAAQTSAGAGQLRVASPTDLTALGFKFDGAPSCSSEKCHGAEKAVERPDFWGNEYTLWHGRKDPHHTAYRMLLNAQSKQIAAKLNIPQANKSARCTTCHTTDAAGPAGKDLQGKEYSAAEGVSCDSCHGPSQKWLEPHAQTGWIKQQRAATKHGELLKTWGLFDTRPIPTRADRCVGCHLSTGADLVAAGHPQPIFEMNHFSNIYPDRHWRDNGAFTPPQLWATGQVAELRETMLRLATEASASASAPPPELKRAYERALAHFTVTRLVLSKAESLDASERELATAMTKQDLAGVAKYATAIAQQSEAIRPIAADFKPDPAAALAALSHVAADTTLATLGPDGQEQQAYAIEALAQAAGSDAVLKTVQSVLPKKPGEIVPPDQFAKGLQDVRSKLH